tara:strand:+ start:988 stop:1350 length:363 start_codon:yes stop_codon:yes gene_type:complete
MKVTSITPTDGIKISHRKEKILKLENTILKKQVKEKELIKALKLEDLDYILEPTEENKDGWWWAKNHYILLSKKEKKILVYGEKEMIGAYCRLRKIGRDQIMYEDDYMTEEKEKEILIKN